MRAYLLLLLALPITATAQSSPHEICNHKPDQVPIGITVHAGHKYDLNGKAAPLTSILPYIHRNLTNPERDPVYIFADPDAQFGDVQGVINRISDSIPHARIAIVEPPGKGDDMFRCAPAEETYSAPDLIQRIPKAPSGQPIQAIPK